MCTLIFIMLLSHIDEENSAIRDKQSGLCKSILNIRYLGHLSDFRNGKKTAFL